MSGTPLPIDGYSRFFQNYFVQNEQRADAAGFLAFWGKPGDETRVIQANEIFNIDIQKSTGQELALMIPRGTQSTPIDRKIGTGEDYTNIGVDFGLIEDEAKLSQKEELSRLAGELPGANVTRQERRHSLALKMHMKSVGKIFRTHAYLAAQAVLTGKHDQILKTKKSSKIYDFRRSEEAFKDLTGAEWNTEASDKMGNLDAGCEWLLANGYIMPDVCIMGQGMMASFIEDEKIMKLADNRAIELIRVNNNLPVPPEYARLMSAGFLPWGRLRTLQGYHLWLFSFPHNYKDPHTQKVEKYMPKDTVLITSLKCRCDRYFGPRDAFDLTSGDIQWYMEMFGFSPTTPPMPFNVKKAGSSLFDPRAIYCDAYPISGRKGVIFRTQSAPIYATTDTDCFYVLNNGLAEG